VTRLAILVAAACAVLGIGCNRPLPPALTREDVVAELVRDLATPPAGARWGRLDPGDALRADGARQSLVVPPGGRVEWKVTVPEGGVLRAGMGVEGEKKSDDARAGLRFAIAVDGEPLHVQAINPAAARRDRRWYDVRLDLDRWRGRAVTLTLAVDADAGGAPAGAAGFSRVRVLRARSVARQDASPTRPNVLVVLVDTLRADAVGPHRDHPSDTPHLDALAARGLAFSHAVSQSSWTLQSVASLMTGLHSRSHGALGRHGQDETNAAWGVLGDAPTTWAEAAADAGITPFGVSANPLVSQGTNLAQGFETFVELPWNPEARAWASAGAVNTAFDAWLRRAGGRRFVAYLHYMEPHDPYTPPDPPPPSAGVRTALAKGWIRDLANRVNWQNAPGPSAEELAHLRACYRGEVAAWDTGFGALLELLASHGLSDRTVVVVTSDHGEEFQEHGRLTHGSHLYDETIRVPLVIAGPQIPAGRRDDQVQGIDLFPTLVRVLGLPAPPRLPGRDVLEPFAAERPAVVETSSGIAADGGALDLIAVRTRRWKLIETPATARREIYDLVADPAERDDRGGGPDALAGTLAAWRDSTPTAVDPRGDPALADRLRTLGYVE